MRERKRIRYLIVTAYVCTVANFILDWVTPHGVGNWVLYIPIILTPLWYNNSRHVIYASVGCSALVVIGFFVSPPGITYFWAVMNRVFVLTALWLTALAGIIIVNRSNQLAEALSIVEQESAHRKEAEDRLRLAMEGVGMGTWDADLRTGKEVWSETQFRLLGYEPTPGGEGTRDMWLSRVHPEDRRLVLESRKQAEDDQASFRFEYRIWRPDESKVRWIEGHGLFHYDDKGTPIRYVGVCFDITRRKELENELLEVAARQQQDIGQELHDGVGQEVTGLGLMAKTLAQGLTDDEAAKRIATRLIAGLDHVHRQIRELSRGLLPVYVDAGGLPTALDDLAARTRKMSEVSVTCECPDWVEMPDHATATQMFRIAQEAVTNALRHGRPQQIRLSLLSEANELRLRIQDDGIGLQGPPERGDGLGFRIMKYRADLIGGILQIGTSDAGGTLVTLTLPWSERNVEKEPGACGDCGANSHRG